MGIIKKRILGEVARSLLPHTDLDLRMARLRLKETPAFQAELSGLFSIWDSPGQPNAWLLDLALASVARARSAEVPILAERNAPSWVLTWPGEHYKLLHAIVQETRPSLVLEIGTYTGLSALAMLSALPADAKLITVDVLSWDKVPGTFLLPTDFADGRFCQLVCDFGARDVSSEHAELLRKADMIFVDADPHDGVLERKLLANFRAVGLKAGALLVFDDIRHWKMLSFWRGIECSKLDLTSFGHWSGTGLVQWGKEPNLFVEQQDVILEKQ